MKLDGWEPEDNALKEHLAHAPHCIWAICVSTSRLDGEEPETRDPMSDHMVAARTGTFTIGPGWVHESKRGWKCKIAKLVNAGWVHDPSPDAEDGVTCMHCDLSLDGWEPKDDPAEEHKRREPNCPFFVLVDRYTSTGGKTDGRRNGRGSTTSKSSRLSTQSAMSTFSQEPSLADLGDHHLPAESDDSVMTTASQATAKAGSKKARPVKAAKGARAKNLSAQEDEIVPAAYPVLDTSQQEGAQRQSHEEAPIVRPGRSVGQQSNAVDSSMMNSSLTIAGSKKKSQKPKSAQPSTPELELSGARDSDASVQLQEELETSLDPAKETTPEHDLKPSRPRRGIKRNSDGLQKKHSRDSSLVTVDFPVPPMPVTKGKRGRKPKLSTDEHAADEVEVADSRTQQIDEHVQISEAEPQRAAKPAKTKKPASKKGKGKKTSSARSSKATVTGLSPEPKSYSAEDLARDEMEIEAELGRIAAEQQVADAADEGHEMEFEPSPSHAQRHALKIHELEHALRNEELVIPNPSLNMANFIATVADKPLPPPERAEKAAATCSPSGSDKENQTSSVTRKLTSPPPATWMSPTKTFRVPLAPGTPNRSLAKQTLLDSPSKQFSHLSSTTPWDVIDLDAILLASPQPTPNTLAQRLAGAAGLLPSLEKGLSVEAWVRYRAQQGDEDLKRKCEEMVGGFEREGMRALRSLEGIVTL